MRKYILLGIIIGIGGLGIMILPNILKKEIKITSIQKFRYSYTQGYSMNAEVIYSLECNDACEIEIKPYLEEPEKTRKLTVGKDFKEKLESILRKYHVGKWNGFNKNNPYVLDGDSFSLSIVFQNGTSISASGYMKWPKQYREVKKEIDILFLTQIQEGDL